MENFMTPQQYIKQEILSLVIGWKKMEIQIPQTGEEVDKLYNDFVNDDNTCDYIQDAKGHVRTGQYQTKVDNGDYSRNYENESVCLKTEDGKYVGWTYWFGGGKHGNPSSIDWISDAYFLECEEKKKVVIVRTFKIIK